MQQKTNNIKKGYNKIDITINEKILTQKKFRCNYWNNWNKIDNKMLLLKNLFQSIN